MEPEVIVLSCLSQCPASKHLLKETNRLRKHKAKKCQLIFILGYYNYFEAGKTFLEVKKTNL